ncbi:hypothetical protein JMA_35490 [Jeotgalibacillus malaysiensis]|uniref:Uncharacterized protein n=1 Tax=Jeotgalibacillus malaysiensis TaxID=1508404 RepID=A0A0B5AS33_9BACL|nr:hypothetical protein [Jeotgalibacillus malaysiensis]AJD92866.1 hypothetical protein JMA_35490 [Jeotgalibacillus malaysiensis]
MAINRKQCPSCGAKNAVKILYGEPTYEAYLESEKGNLQLGGCCVSPDSPDYHCKNCGHEWTRE